MTLPSHIYKRNNVKATAQAVSPLLLACVTGYSTVWLWEHNHLVACVAIYICHCNIFGSMGTAIHELSHGTVFSSRRWNRFFLKIYEVLHWTYAKPMWLLHWEHHKHTLHTTDDPELDINCRPVWIGTLIWATTLNCPRLVNSLLFGPLWIRAIHLGMASYFVMSGMESLLLLITLSSFVCPCLSALCILSQHVGKHLNSQQGAREANSLKLPLILSLLNWRMEHHLEHHLYPNVPCYNLWMVRQYDYTLPPTMTIWQALREIWRRKEVGQCGHGLNPLQRIRNGATIKELL